MGTVVLAWPDPFQGCSAVEVPVYNDTTNLEPKKLIFYMVRGGCSFVTKAYYAQIAGATALIV